MEYYPAFIKKEILPFVTTWMKLKDIWQTATSQSQKDKYGMIPLIWGTKIARLIEGENRMVVITRGWEVGEIWAVIQQV